MSNFIVFRNDHNVLNSIHNKGVLIAINNRF